MTKSMGYDQKPMSAADSSAALIECKRPFVTVSEGVNGNLICLGADTFAKNVYWSVQRRPLTRDQAKAWLRSAFNDAEAENALRKAEERFAAGEYTRPGVITDGLFAGMTAAEVLADRDAYNRACGE